ncbi:testis-expressed protein 47-like isoform X1 [Engraulis encrasicolus]|uniref:testis-expressed protein 47-like isoform X1 n=2 Tax=Engraulis encrasicolus TaxID=184585 RepID=UPI002FD5CE08
MAGNRVGLPSGVSPYVSSYKNSLFSEVEKQKSSYKRCFIHKLIYIARIASPADDDKRNAIAGHHEQFVNKIQKNNQTEGITGHLLIYQDCIVHIIETSSENLTLIMKDVSNLEQGANPLLKDARILVISYGVFNRMFTSWATQTISVCSVQESSEQTDPEELLAHIYALCTSIQKTKGQGTNVVLAGERALLLVEEGVRNLCQSSMLRSPSDFLNTYKRAIDVVLDSEIVWPTPTRLYW